MWCLVALQAITLAGWCGQTACQINYTPGQCINIIQYDGSSPYTPPTGTELKQVPDGTNMGDNVGE